jgi:hypothetical protein
MVVIAHFRQLLLLVVAEVVTVPVAQMYIRAAAEVVPEAITTTVDQAALVRQLKALMVAHKLRTLEKVVVVVVVLERQVQEVVLTPALAVLVYPLQFLAHL